jgi:cell division protein FtsL
MQSIYFVKKIDNSRFVPLENPAEPRQYVISTVIGALVLATAVFAAMGRFQSLEYGYRIERLEKEKKIALETNRKLQLEEASLGDPLRIDWIARNELGMKTLAPNQIHRAEAESAPAVAMGVAGNDKTNEPVLTARIQNLR